MFGVKIQMLNSHHGSAVAISSLYVFSLKVGWEGLSFLNIPGLQNEPNFEKSFHITTLLLGK